MVDRLRSMEVFVATVEAGSFAAAASALGLSSQMVGKHVSAIEKRLGARLLNRSTRHQSLTDAGSIYLDRCRRALAEAEDAEARVAVQALAPRGALRITAPVAFGSRRLVPELAGFLAQFPHVSLNVELSDKCSNLIEEGFDAAIRVGDLSDSSLAARALAPYRLIACASPDYLARRGTPIHPDDLKLHDCLSYGFHRRPGPSLWVFSADGTTITVDPPARLVVNDIRALIEAAAVGAGIVLAAEALLADHLAAGDLVRVMPRHEGVVTADAHHLREPPCPDAQASRVHRLGQRDIRAKANRAGRVMLSIASSTRCA